MLPNFLIIGVEKGATTWLAKCLGQHPDVFIPEIKEAYFFTRDFEKGVAWYESQYFSDWSGEKAVGEATPGYIYYSHVPDRIRATLGKEVKLIASLRHPVDRAYSAFWMFMSRGRIPADADFPTFFRQDTQFKLHNRGYYYAQLRHYLDVFPRENLLILIYEEIKRDNPRAIHGCFEFLSVDPQFLPPALEARVNKGVDVSVIHHQVWGARRAIKSFPPGIERPLAFVGRRIFNWLPRRKTYEPLDGEVRQELLQDFMSDIRQLEEVLGLDLSIWYAL